MSRAYRLRLEESLRRVVRAADEARAELALLPILPADELAELLSRELAARGFERQPAESGWEMVRRQGAVEIRVALPAAQVTARAAAETTVALTRERRVLVFDDQPARAERSSAEARRELRAELEREAARQERRLREQTTETLAAALDEARAELQAAARAATVEALQIKAARLGRVKELTRNEQTGELKIVVEV